MLRLPSREHPDELGEMTHQDKMFGIFKEHHQWQNIIGLRTIGDLNGAIISGKSSQLIQISEALQEKKIGRIADEIAQRVNPPASLGMGSSKGVRLVLIAGPSSSGKTASNPSASHSTTISLIVKRHHSTRRANMTSSICMP